MVENNYIIHWDKNALKSFKELIAYIKKDSLQNAEKVKQDVLNKIDSLTKNSEIYTPDKYKLFNENFAYRAFEIHSIRISYFV